MFYKATTYRLHSVSEEPHFYPIVIEVQNLRWFKTDKRYLIPGKPINYVYDLGYHNQCCHNWTVRNLTKSCSFNR